MLLAQLLDNFRSGRWFVSNRLSANSFLQGVNHFRRKSVLVHRESLIEPYTRHFPVSRCRVFSRRVRRTFAIRTAWFPNRRQMRERLDICQAQLHQIWNSQRARFRNMPQRVSPHVAIVLSIRQLANSHAVQHNPDHTSKTSHSSAPKPQLTLRDSSTAPRHPLFRPF